MKTLYKRDAKGMLRIWNIEALHNGLEISHGVVGGNLTEAKHPIRFGKGGRSVPQQIALEYKARVQHRLDKGYREDFDTAGEQPVNQLGYVFPMLAQPLNKVADFPSDFSIQYKYDGNRCMVVKRDGKMMAYSRGGKEITSIPHILDACADIPEGLILDGELYVHGERLQTIRSWVARKQLASTNLKFVCYDVVSDLTYLDRLHMLESFHFIDPVRIASTTNVFGGMSTELLQSTKELAIASGYEGLIVRTHDTGYECGKRSKSLIKIKSWDDEEFTVVDILPSVDMCAILVCELGDGSTFKVTAPGPIVDKMRIYDNRSEYISRRVTVQFAGRTKDGIPFHPVALSFREEHE